MGATMVGRINSLLYLRLLFVLSLCASLGIGVWYLIERTRLVPRHIAHLTQLADQRSEALQKHIQKQEALLNDFIHTADASASLVELLSSNDQKLKDA